MILMVEKLKNFLQPTKPATDHLTLSCPDKQRLLYSQPFLGERLLLKSHGAALKGNHRFWFITVLEPQS